MRGCLRQSGVKATGEDGRSSNDVVCGWWWGVVESLGMVLLGPEAVFMS